MNVTAALAAVVAVVVAGGACSSSDPAPPAKRSLEVENLDAGACEAYAAKQTRLNPDGPAWTFRMTGTTCVVTQG
jgi:FlaG/FlaF family flagellin (archaellin)